MWQEIIGICGSLLIVVSMCFKTTTYKSRIYMRVFNIIGSIVFVVYGALLPAISTAVLNGILVVVNTYHLVRNIVKQRKRVKQLSMQPESYEQKNENMDKE